MIVVQSRDSSLCWGYQILFCFVFVYFILSSVEVQLCVGSNPFCVVLFSFTLFFLVQRSSSELGVHNSHFFHFSFFHFFMPGCYPRRFGSLGGLLSCFFLMGSGLQLLLGSLCVHSTY